MQKKFEIDEPPPEGVYIRGLFMEGARWNMDNMVVDESIPKILYDEFPPVSMAYQLNLVIWIMELVLIINVNLSIYLA